MSFRTRTIVLCLPLLLALEACAPRPSSEVLTPVLHAPSYTPKVQLLVATTRAHGPEPEAYTAQRSRTVNHAALTISIPRRHKAGEIEWPDQPLPDPALHFLTTKRENLEDADFLARIQSRAMAGGQEADSVLVFIHGYNTTYEEAVFRFAQIVHDSGYTGSAVLFAWPSRGKTSLYLADRDASTYSRDYLERTLLEIAALRGVREINILAHSMGNWLAVETLRQAKMKGHGDFDGKLGDIILASPDIDATVFRTQLDVIAPMRRPITVMVSGDDQALAASTLLSGGVKRVGQLDTHDERVAAAIRRYNIRVVDLTKINDGPGPHHNKFAQGDVLRSMGKSLLADDMGKKVSSGGVMGAVTEVGTSLMKVPGAVIGVGAD